jgi:hypothetical protein
MRTVDIRIHRGEAITKALRDEALSGEMITLIESVVRTDIENTWITFEACRVKLQAIHYVPDSIHPVSAILERYSPDDPVNFVTLVEKELG